MRFLCDLACRCPWTDATRMESHLAIIIILCVLGFFKEFRPSEPYLSPFLNGPKNFTESEITNEIYPVGTYSYMSLLIVVFLLTDWLKYKPVILLQGLSGIFTWSLLIWSDGIPLMQVAQVSYGLFSACDVAYSSYMYAKIDKKRYQKATAQTKAALLVSKAGSGFVAQVLVMYHVLDYAQLNFLTISALSLATIWAFFLPPVTRSSFFNRSVHEEHNDGTLACEVSPLKHIVIIESGKTHEVDSGHEVTKTYPDESYTLSAIFFIWRDAMRNKHTLKWSLWSALSLCGYLQVSYYIQLLWQAMINAGDQSEEPEELYHGFSNSFNSLAGALCTYAVGYLNLNWSRYGEVTLALAAILQGCAIIFASYWRAGLVAHYVIYALFKILYQASSTIVSSEIAKSLESESFGLVFGANQFVALVAQSILTALVTQAFPLGIRTQFFIYGAYFITLGVGFAVAGVYTMISWKCKREGRPS